MTTDDDEIPEMPEGFEKTEFGKTMAPVYRMLQVQARIKAKERAVEEARRVAKKGPEERLQLYRFYAMREVWLLKAEAVPLLFALDPVVGTPSNYEGTPPTKIPLTQHGAWKQLESAAQAGLLGFDSSKGPPDSWRVRPGTLLSYWQKKELPYHLELEQALNERGQLSAASIGLKVAGSDLVRFAVRAQDAGYPVEAIQAALHAICELWLAFDPKSGENKPSNKTVKDWLAKKYPELGSNQLKDIDRLIRHPRAYKTKSSKTRKPSRS